MPTGWQRLCQRVPGTLKICSYLFSHKRLMTAYRTRPDVLFAMPSSSTLDVSKLKVDAAQIYSMMSSAKSEPALRRFGDLLLVGVSMSSLPREELALCSDRPLPTSPFCPTSFPVPGVCRACPVACRIDISDEMTAAMHVSMYLRSVTCRSIVVPAYSFSFQVLKQRRHYSIGQASKEAYLERGDGPDAGITRLTLNRLAAKNALCPSLAKLRSSRHFD